MNSSEKRTDSSLLVITQLSQLLTYLTGFGGLVVPLILWLTQKDKVEEMDVHGKQIINFQISLIFYVIIGIPSILLFGLGILLLVFTGIIGFVLPIINAIRASNSEAPSYFATLRFIK
ncbi:MAG: DUF4870 domain-containing protein [Flavobacteriaceae bacterium]